MVALMALNVVKDLGAHDSKFGKTWCAVKPLQRIGADASLFALSGRLR
jgi:hypothetical protein